MRCSEQLSLVKEELKRFKRNVNFYSKKEKVAKLNSIEKQLNKIFTDPDSCGECKNEINVFLKEFSLN
ncbi:hypothetical protein PL373_06135 [Tenacibaculum maritimum]|nr:hypothetical protein [Tenacibaculum maritimum]MDB0600730.1 hypothetical protein [Tenacibaculum maritimum]MDB0612713.1 hypothetical protein [Tenacibaculum maritimum]